MLKLINILDKRTRDGRKIGLYLCDCGNKKEIIISSVKSGNTKSCGCLISKRGKERFTKHNKSKIPEYYVLSEMKSRCYNINCKDYPNYGARGIVVCDRWLESFENFYEDMGPRPNKGYLIDRIDNNGNYCPENCKWSTIKESNRNSRNCHLIEYKGEIKTIAEWAEIYDLNSNKLWARIVKLGWDIEKALTTKSGSKSHPRKFITFNGERKALCEWAKQFNIDQGILSKRLNRDGWSVERALTTPTRKYKDKK